MELKCLIIDDDIMARTSLNRLCQTIPELKLVGCAEDGKHAKRLLAENTVDLLFLDVEMPELSGIDLLNQLPVLPMVIFTTAKKDYALDAFRYDAIDYLVKPITPDQFRKAVIKAISKEASNPKSDDLYIKSNKRYVRIKQDDILYFENVGDYIKVITDNKNYIFYGTMKEIIEKLNTEWFMKVHRSFIVNLNHIDDIEDNTIQIDGKIIPISRANRPQLMSKLNVL
ncbi:response regulator transcription factor [Puteibacter caeruleilacunae]|nr:response regulator transcription factor [Puteibacter caeruleilacunae]